MKSKALLCLLLLLSLFVISFPAFAATGIPIYLDDKKMECDALPVTVNNRIMVPIRTIAESLGADVIWQNQNININRAGNQLKLTLGSNKAYKNGIAIATLEAAPFIYNNRTMVPLRLVAETFGVKVNYIDGKVMLNRATVCEKDKAYFFDLAQAKRFDHLPELTKNYTPSLNDLLMYTYFSMDNFKEYDKMTTSQVDKVAKEQFGVENLTHQSTKEWKLTGDIYSATGWSWSSACFYDLKEIKSYTEGSKAITEVLLDQYVFDEYSYEPIDFMPDFAETYSDSMMYVIEKKASEIKKGLNVTDAIKALIVAGDTSHFNYKQSLRIKYYIEESSGNMVFTYINSL